VGITDEIAALAPVAGNQQQTPSWIQDAIDKRGQPKTERLKRNPIGFQFQQNPFDPSSYYKQLGSFRDISRGATAVSGQEAQNSMQAEIDRQNAANQQEVLNRLSGVNPQLTYSDGSVTPNNSGSKKYGLKGISPIASKAANYFGSRYGIKTIGGLGPGSVPGSDHPHGRALDYMINNIKNGHATGDALANDVIKNYKAWNVKYVIWNRYIWFPGSGWHKYSGPSPHTDHVHVSFNK
jgi:hypothetical protein